MSTLIVDAFENSSLAYSESLEPFYTVANKPEKEKLEWLNAALLALMEQAESRSRVQRANLYLYRGVSMKKWERQRDRGYREPRLSKLQKFVVNHLHDLTETKVSQMTRIKPAVEIIPANDEWADRASAKVAKAVLDSIWDQSNIDFLIQRMQRYARIFGEAYTFIEWDPNAGDLHPEWVQARDSGVDLKKFNKGMPIKTGDVKYDIEVPWRVFLQRKTKLEDCEYVFRVKLIPTEDLRREYPGKKEKIRESEGFKTFDMDALEGRLLEKHTVVYEFYHVKSKHLPDGRFIRFTEDVILDDVDHPFTHGKLPLCRLTDLDVPDVLNGISRYEQIAPIQRMYDNISTLLAKNIYLTAHAKWVMPRGACKIEQLGNDTTVVQYQGSVAPQMAQVNPNPNEVYRYRQELKEEMQVVYGSHGISRGEVPKGITAATALQFLNELENERASTDIAKHGFLIRDLAKMTIAVAGDKYELDDGRLVRLVGKNKEFLLRHFDTAHLHKNYSIRFDTSTGLPESKSARLQRILDAMQRNPQMVSPERWEYLLDLADTEKMSSVLTEAIAAADSENEDLLAGREVALPERWESHIIHWRSHYKAMQSRQFKEEADPIIRARFKDHIYWTEEAMLEKMKDNPEFEAKLAELVDFPIYRHSNYSTPLSKEHQQAIVQGQANRGDGAISGTIPGEDIEQLEKGENK